MNKTLQLLELGRKIESSNGWRILNKIDGLETSYYIYMVNHNQLEKALEIMNHPKVATELFSVKNRDKMDEFQKEVIRLLFNFLASAKSLTEHTRVFVREMYDGTDFMQEYQEKVDEKFVKSPLSKFIQDFRNYILHKGLPITTASFSFDRDIGMRSSMNIDVNELKNWDRWCGKSQEYMDSLGSEVNLSQIIVSYTELVSDFYDWFWKRQEQMNSNEIEEMHKLQDEYSKLMKEAGLY